MNDAVTHSTKIDILETLDRLKRQTEMAIDLVKSGLLVSDPFYKDKGDRFPIFMVGDFTITDRTKLPK